MARRSATGSSGSPPTRSAWSATTPSIPTGSSPTTGATRCSASSARASRTSPSAARRPAAGASRSPSPRTARPPQREDGSWDPEAGTIYVWYDALINYITGAGFPGDPAAFERWWPADLHVIGKDIARFHTIYWPAMLWSAGLEAPRHVWVHGWLLVQGERMSKSRGNFFDPNAMVDALGTDGTRYVLLREAAFDRDADVSWDSFLRRYNADLANDFGQPRQPHRDDGPPLPWRRAPGAPPRRRRAAGRGLVRTRSRAIGRRSRAAASTTRWPSSPSCVGGANRTVDAEQPWVLAKAAAGGDADAGRRASGASSATSSRPAGCSALVVAPFMPTTAPSVLAQLGYAYPYAGGRQRRAAAARRAGLGRPCGRDRAPGRADAALPATRPRGRSGLGWRIDREDAKRIARSSARPGTSFPIRKPPSVGRRGLVPGPDPVAVLKRTHGERKKVWSWRAGSCDRPALRMRTNSTSKPGGSRADLGREPPNAPGAFE